MSEKNFSGGNGGGAEAHACSKQYDYRENSNLVLTATDRSLSRDTHEPESLWEKIDPKSFGDRAYRGRPSDDVSFIEKSKKKKKKKAESVESEPAPKRRRFGEGGVLSSDADEGGGGVYRPKTTATKRAYEDLLGLIQQQIGGQPPSVISGAADEVLAVVKSEKLTAKKSGIEKLLLNPISDQVFDALVKIGAIITDYENDDVAALDDDDEDDVGMAVEFAEDDDNVEEDLDVIREDDDEEENDEVEEFRAMEIEDVKIMQEVDVDAGELKLPDVDAYWLQRKISEAFDKQIDPEKCQKLAEEVLEILDDDDTNVENKLVQLLEFKNFDLIKMLLKNRVKISWCTRLARAEGEDERKRIEEEMVRLGLRSATRASAKERLENVESGIWEEAKKLKSNVDIVRCGDNSQSLSQSRIVDLERLGVEQTRLLVPKKFPLPDGSYRSHSRKGVEEVHVPAPKPKPFGVDEKLVNISDMPEWTRPAFKRMTQLNRVQSKLYEAAFTEGENILLCAPTGAGKTNVAMLTILREMGLHMNEEDGVIDHSAYKIVYVAPMKALVAEVVGNLSNRLEEFGVKVRELSGDQTLTRREIEETQVIVATPEKWDIITRKSGDRSYMQLVKLLIIDEIHLLHDDRGPVVESIVARTLRQIETTRNHIRLVGLSATLPNFEDVALFLHVDCEKGLFHFNNSYRPVPLSQQYIGISVRKQFQRYQLMNEVCYEKVMAAAGKHQILIFVHSRNETAKTARALRDNALANDTLGRFLREDCVSREILQSHTDLLKSNDLKNLVPYGFAIHHAGLRRTDRQLVEDLFAEGHVQVLVSTATLAWGVNLPAHTVIIKGTQVYDAEKNAWTELSPLDVMQMLGRAGRPQYDTYGEGIIITGHTELHYYLSMMNQQLPIESRFVSRLADQLNAEIVLGTVQNAQEASLWLGYTYLFIRMLRNPTLYGLEADVLVRDVALEERRADLIHSAATILEKNNLIKYDRKSGYFQVTDLGRIASYYYITHGTISTYNEHLKPTMGDIELYRLFSLSEEFKYVTVRQDEKNELIKLMENVPIPVKENVEDPSAKINVLLQAYISQLKFEGMTLTSDMVYITQSAGRLVRALFEIVLKRGWAHLAEKTLNLSKMVNKRMWSVQTPLLQFNGVEKDILNKIEKIDMAWERYYDLSLQELGELVHKPKEGRNLYKVIHQFPKLNLAAHVQPITRTLLRVELTITPDFQWEDKVHGFAEPFWVLVEDHDGEHILHHEYFVVKKQYIDEDHTLNFTVQIYEPLPPHYFIRVVSDRWLGSQTVLPVSFKYLILPEKFPPPTELLDLQPYPVTILRDERYEALYQDIKQFNPVQTQVFNALYDSDENVLVAAPTGSGKTICAEFAVLRNHHHHHKDMRVVYIAPVEGLAKERYTDWERKFGMGQNGLKLRVVELTGEISMDLKLLEKSEIVISTPDKWDALSRRWRQRKYVQQVSLFVVDELHLIGGGQAGPVLEVIVSRMRYMASQLESKIRIVALSTSLANAKDLGDWIGVTSRGLFNFPPSVRAVPEIHIWGVDIADFKARMQAMTRPTYTAIVQHAKNGKPALVYVPTRKHIRQTAQDLMDYSYAEEGDAKPSFLLRSIEEMEPFIEKISNAKLQDSLRHGVGFLHEGLTSIDQDIVSTLFEAEYIQVCVMSSSLSWRVPLSAHLVVVMGTQYYESRENVHADYPVTDLLQMIGHACRPKKDNSGKCVVFCHAPRKEYYKKILHEALPVESHFHHYLHDNINAEVVTGGITSEQDAVDYFTWTYFYRTLTQNPNYYNLQGVTPAHISEYLSELVENTVNDLATSNCIAVENGNLSGLNLGMIASYYYISYATVERFSSSLTAKTKMKGLLEILSHASEYSQLPIRPGEEEVMRRLINHQRFSIEHPNCTDPHVKANVLLQAHFARHNVSGNLSLDQREILLSASRLLQAMVDVISSNGWLTLSLLAMEVSQMVTQGMWDRDSLLRQLPHFTMELARRCHEKSIERVSDLADMVDEERQQLLQELLEMSETQSEDVERFCKRFPNVDMTFKVLLESENEVTLQVDIDREQVGGPVAALRYPKIKEEGWWLVVGDTKTNSMLAIKRVPLQRKASVKLKFSPPAAKAGTKKTYTLYLMSDSYLGCDEEHEFSVDVKETGKV